MVMKWNAGLCGRQRDKFLLPILRLNRPRMLPFLVEKRLISETYISQAHQAKNAAAGDIVSKKVLVRVWVSINHLPLA